jgi:hypothetical protein
MGLQVKRNYSCNENEFLKNPPINQKIIAIMKTPFHTTAAILALSLALPLAVSAQTINLSSGAVKALPAPTKLSKFPPLPSGMTAKANTELSVYSVAGTSPAGAMPLVKRVMTDGNGFFRADGLPAGSNYIVDTNGTQYASLTQAQLMAQRTPALGQTTVLAGRAVIAPMSIHQLTLCDPSNNNIKWACK